MKFGRRNWCLRKLIGWLEPPLNFKQYARARRQFGPELERKMRQEIRRGLKQQVWGLNLRLGNETAESR